MIGGKRGGGGKVIANAGGRGEKGPWSPGLKGEKDLHGEKTGAFSRTRRKRKNRRPSTGGKGQGRGLPQKREKKQSRHPGRSKDQQDGAAFQMPPGGKGRDLHTSEKKKKRRGKICQSQEKRSPR